ncbi:MAG TPA: coproporphyrinogen III oxidase family protein [Flexistipes sinusarabici]|uniref:Coproporphyrinogen III oxidase family protein n=1 Tax=Flexistipes sinusarabici TaxID=2352 RepID=A0A3D5QGD6_FLESI|nr:coproporphyrinogen III oxidase family protein [Flexistipes sinusarabici]
MFDNNTIRMDFRARFASKIMKSVCSYYLKPKKFNTDFPECTDNKKRLLYLHIPFCFSFCTYCTFHKFIFDQETAETYFSLLKKEMQLIRKKGYNFAAMYIGGGTPTVLPAELAGLIDYAKELFDIKEVSCESDPDHVSSPILENTVDRIDRLSVGIQTFNDNYLKLIGRYDKFGSGESQLEKVKNLMPHFPIVNIDMIYNYPGQKKEELLNDISKVLSTGSQQITFYPLMFSSNSDWGIKNREGSKSYKRESELFQLILTNMDTKKYEQRTQWAFSKDTGDIIDEYVIDNDEYIGLGSGAFGFIGDTLYINSFSLKEYGKLIEDNKISAVKYIRFGRHAIKQYRMIVDLFGFNLNGKTFPEPEFSLLKLSECIQNKNGAYMLTPQGEFIISLMMSEFYDGMNRVRTAMRKELTDEDSVFET